MQGGEKPLYVDLHDSSAHISTAKRSVTAIVGSCCEESLCAGPSEKHCGAVGTSAQYSPALLHHKERCVFYLWGLKNLAHLKSLFPNNGTPHDNNTNETP